MSDVIVSIRAVVALTESPASHPEKAPITSDLQQSISTEKTLELLTKPQRRQVPRSVIRRRAC